MNFICSINGQSLVKFDCCNYACNMIKIHIPVAPTSYKHAYICSNYLRVCLSEKLFS